MKNGFFGCLLFLLVFALFSFFIYHFVFLSSDKKVNEQAAKVSQQSTSTIADFQEVKQELGYKDPDRFRDTNPVSLIKGLIAALGVWMVLIIILYFLFYQTPSSGSSTPEELTRGGHIKPRNIKRSFDD